MPARPRFLTLFALFLATGLLAFAYLQKTVYHGAGERLSAEPGAIATRTIIERWSSHGFFASYGMLAPVPGQKIVYRWSSGAYFWSSYVIEKLWMAMTGKYSWRLIALHNVMIALITSALFGVLAFRVARRIGAEPLHALALAIGAQMVQFTFPDNVALYWENQSQVWWLAFAICFFLAEEGERPLLQALSVFGMTYIEFIDSTMFLAAYAATVLLLRGERPPLRRLALLLIVPWLVSMSIYQLQWQGAKREPGLKILASGFLYRTGLDGDAQLYGDHLDIAYGRDFIRRHRLGHPQYCFRWPVLFFAGTAAAIIVLGAYLRGRAPRLAALVLFALLGAYVLYAAVFSQAVALHPYLYDFLLATPLIFALFALLPALAEEWTQWSGVIVTAFCFAAAWMSMFQLRLYALCYASV
ncbi:MAG TPA: hypothetical protein VG323_14005 [Thermoanaerobaculia bacterium]|nr:hypothetical protein [Thermoanaerobaculia bacterium]